MQGGNDRAQVGITAALAIAIHGSLYLDCATFNGCQRISYCEIAIVVRMDAQRTTELDINRFNDGRNFRWQRAAVSIA